MNEKQLFTKFKKFAKENFVELNPDKEEVSRIVDKELKNIKEKGQPYCPCRVVTGDMKRDKMIICPCKYALGEIELQGKCLCGLFVKGD